MANGDGGEYAHWLLDTKQADPCAWQQVTGFEDSVKKVSFSNDGAVLYLRSVQGAPRGKILRLPADGSVALADAPVLVPEGDAVMERLVATASHLYLSEMVGGPSRVRRFNLMGGNPSDLPIPAACGVMDLMALADHAADDRVLYRLTRYTEPDALSNPLGPLNQNHQPKNSNEFEQEEAERAEVQELITEIADC